MMDEHVHKWDSVHDGGVECGFVDCGAELNLREIERRLNATEWLTAADANIVTLTRQDTWPDWLTNKLMIYAYILEGKDG